jgi:hypothetical protein
MQLERPPFRVYLGVFLIALSGLMFEIGLTRIFSATIWYHFAFVAISVALLGWGLGGFALHLLRDRIALSHERAAVLTLIYAATIPLGLGLMLRFPFHSDLLPLYFAVALVPFLLAGAALSMLFALNRATAGRLYFADLLGASLGALLVTLLLSLLGGEGAVLAIALAPLVAAACLWRRLTAVAAVGAVLVVGALVFNERSGTFKIKNAPSKGMYRHMAAQPDARIVHTGWNAYSRIDAVSGLSTLARLYIDSDAWTNLHRWDGRVESLAPLREWHRARAFQFFERPQVLVIGPGGGSDVLVALGSGAQKVTAVEMNPLMLRFVRSYGAEAGNLYDHPLVETHLSEGRNFLARTDRKWDVIFLGFVDSWAAVASGGLSLSENFLYTTDAFRAYYDHLSPDGVLTIMRWDSDIPRLVANAVALLGAQQASERVVVLLERRGTKDDPAQMTFMLRRRPFTEAERDQIQAWSEARPVILPGRVAEEPYGGLLSGQKTLAQYEDEAPKLVGPVFDDRPFYFAQFKPWGVPPAMFTALGVIVAPLAVLLAILVALGRPRGAALGRYAGSVAYFACLGLGFIMVELCLLQDLTLLLGHPIFTLSILLFTLLAAGGLGAAQCARFDRRNICLAVAGLGIVYAVVLPKLVPLLLPLELWARIAIAVALIAPLGFCMGMPFPSGLARVGQGPFPAAPFYWGLNGVLSVVGSVGTMALAVNVGFRAAMIVGSLFYILAALAAGALRGAEEQQVSA